MSAGGFHLLTWAILAIPVILLWPSKKKHKGDRHGH